jgi:REP element-mobilizing transposase RayT
MPHSYTRVLVHSVFSTKHRANSIEAEWQADLWAYISGIARTNRFQALAVGGMENHAHALLSLPGVMAVAKAVQLIKGGSSKWVHEQLGKRAFEWQEGYGAFSIGQSQVHQTIDYIARQQEHHKTRSFEEEFLAILKKHGIDYDPKYVWG